MVGIHFRAPFLFDRGYLRVLFRVLLRVCGFQDYTQAVPQVEPTQDGKHPMTLLFCQLF